MDLSFWEQILATSPWEFAAVFLSLLYVFLAIRGSKWCWPPGLIGSAIFVVIFWKSQLFAEAGLYVMYVVLAVYGWLSWSNQKGQKTFVVKRWSLALHLKIFLLSIVALVALKYLLVWLFPTEARPWLDSTTSIFAVLATLLTAKKVLANWVYWLGVNILSVYLYLKADLEFAALQMLIFALLSVVGWFQWKKMPYLRVS